jgi:2-polyprenyl-3-methyl-5-hydroxy-6-metoxy-1,4-benzoquinol methylase
MSDQDSTAAEPRWNSEVAEKWLSRVDGIERSGAPIRELLMERARLQPGERVLDVGCGSGPSTAAAATAVHPGGMVTAIDIAAPMIAAARQRLETAKSSGSSVTPEPMSCNVRCLSTGRLTRLRLVNFTKRCGTSSRAREGIKD